MRDRPEGGLWAAERPVNAPQGGTVTMPTWAREECSGRIWVRAEELGSITP